MKLAIIITCHNRKYKTLNSLKAVYAQKLNKSVTIEIYLTDDGSTDGTSEEIKKLYPKINIIEGAGNLFWNRGMHLAFAEALKKDYDHYLWLNDDTILFPCAINKLLNSYKKICKTKNYQKILIAGSTRDPKTGELTYGGVINNSFWHPLKLSPVQPKNTPQRCHTTNGNCVLIPRDVASIVGNLDCAFTHSIGDFDYGLRARKKGCALYIAPGFIGTCSRNKNKGTWKDTSLTLIERLRKKQHSKGVPLNEWIIFVRRHGGLFWPIFVISPYIKMLFYSISFSKQRG